ncbi:bZIP transcription factor [Myxococcus sp. Y35]|uniref:bZIP transcription factor n=1 Tax=Pseudomyxococcus flavus TaxID=3115648 RepID=UPI003CEDA14D
MLRKASGWMLGIVGLSLLLCGGTAAAQDTRQVPAQAGQASGQALSETEAANLQREVDQLRADLSQLRQEVTQLRAQQQSAGGATVGGGAQQGVAAQQPQGTGGGGTQQGVAAQQPQGSGATTGAAQDTAAQQPQGSGATTGAPQDSAAQQEGTGGAGVPPGARVVRPRQDVAAQQGTGGTGQGGVVSDVPPAGSDVPSPPGTAVVDAVYTGVVRSVGEDQVAIAFGEGPPLTLRVDPRTRVLRDGKNIALRKLEPGEQVRAVVDLLDNERTTEISVLPSAAPGK